jgi:hypothetical protein
MSIHSLTSFHPELLPRNHPSAIHATSMVTMRIVVEPSRQDHVKPTTIQIVVSVTETAVIPNKKTDLFSTQNKRSVNMENIIALFETAGTNRGNNDSANKQREDFLCILHTLDIPLAQKWRDFLATLCTLPYDSIQVKKKAGRSANYDLDIRYMKDGNVVHEIKGEFKHNAKKIDALPEYLSVASNKPYLPASYAEYFYDNFIDKICMLDPTLVKPDRNEYIKFVYNNNYDVHPFFASLYANERNYYSKKRAIVKTSIRMYLEENARHLNLQALTDDIRSRQSGKVYILWDLEKFVADTIRDEEMEIVSVEKVKNGNVIVAMSRAGTRHNMLLRWKNHLGVLYPAWQISLSR